MSRAVACPYCGGAAVLVDSSVVYGPGRSFGMIWDCRPCDAYVGVHRNSKDFRPLGTLANRELRGWRGKAHKAFDALWQGPNAMTRHDAYRMLDEAMGKPKGKAHIAQFSVEECQLVVKTFGKQEAAK